MAGITIVTRAGKGSKLTHTELDANFTNLAVYPNNQFQQAKALAGTVRDVLGIGSDDIFKVGHASHITQILGSSLSLTGNIKIGGAAGDVPLTPLQVAGAGDVLVTLNALYGSNLYYSGGWKYAANGYAGAVKVTESSAGAFQVILAPSNAGGAGATAVPVERFRIQNAGSINIPGSLKIGGTAGDTPTALLEIYGSAPVLNIGGAALTTGQVAIQVGEGRTGSGPAYIDFIGDATYTDFGLRIIRDGSDGGVNAVTSIIARGTGGIRIRTSEAAPISFFVTDVEKIRLQSGGDANVVGSIKIGGSLGDTPLAKLHVVSAGDYPARFDRGNDGAVILIMRNGNSEGDISVAGTTVSYNAFLGSHESQLKDPSEGALLQEGMIMSVVEERLVKYFDTWIDPAGNTHKDYIDKKHELYEYRLDDGFIVEKVYVDKMFEETVKALKVLELDTSVFEQIVLHTVTHEERERLPCVEIAKVPNDIKVVGVYGNKNEIGNYMNHALGAAPKCLVKGIVNIGDLITMSDEPGIGVVQADDIVRSSTVGKATKSVTGAGIKTVPLIVLCG